MCKQFRLQFKHCETSLLQRLANVTANIGDVIIAKIAETLLLTLETSWNKIGDVVGNISEYFASFVE